MYVSLAKLSIIIIVIIIIIIIIIIVDIYIHKNIDIPTTRPNRPSGTIR